MKLHYTPRALADVIAIADYIREHNPTAAERVGQAIESSIGRLIKNPRLGIDRPDLAVRKLGVPRYPYSVYYRVAEDRIEIVHIRDDRRKPLEPGDL